MQDNLLLHSMHEFREIILACLEIADVRQAIEVGTEYGGMSTTLNDWLQPRDGHLWCVDPSPKAEFLAWVQGTSGVTHVAAPSLEALPTLPCADAWLLDGDHNWFTVYHELQEVFRACTSAGKPPLVFLHDVGWPCARRDTYYAPERIPAAFRKDHTFNAGTTLGMPHLTPGRAFAAAPALPMPTSKAARATVFSRPSKTPSPNRLRLDESLPGAMCRPSSGWASSSMRLPPGVRA